jgi:transketolase
MPSELDQSCVNTIRFLSVDMVEKANSGHPGLPLGAAPMAYVLWTRFLRHNPKNPHWWDRDRFVLSAGHGSALLYSLLHLTGYDLSLDQIKRFRQWQSKTPGHPESHVTDGVEASTGPLGQGVGNALGMAIGEAHLAAHYNRPGHELFRHFTYVLASDGDMMEGLQSEASSLAGHLGLGRLIVLYDNNHVTLSTTTSVVFSEDVAARYRAFGWHVLELDDGNDLEVIEEAIQSAKQAHDRPSLISVQTVLGYGAPDKQGTYQAHGNPLGAEVVRQAKQTLGWPEEPPFHIPDDALAHFRRAIDRGHEFEGAWRQLLDSYTRAFPELERELARRFSGELPDDWSNELPTFPADAKGLATRKASETVLQALAKSVPELIGGSGDLDPSTFTWLKGCGDFESPSCSLQFAQGLVGGGLGYQGRNIHFGVREHAMAAAINGLAYHGGFIPFAATFLVFSDYMRPSIRLAALAELHSLFVFTHDSIGVGEDGPSHEPIEQLASLRAIPNLLVIRPCDANETRWAWQTAIEQRARPTALVLTRQDVPTLDRAVYAPAELLRRGAYVLNASSEREEPDVILMASGSEVALIAAAEPILRRANVRARLVSMPSWRLFEEQTDEYRQSVLPNSTIARVAVEAASPLGWERWTGQRGAIICIDRFGASAPSLTLFKENGFTVEHVVHEALAVAGQRNRNQNSPTNRMRILVIDVGGTHVKLMATDHEERLKIPSGPRLTPAKLIAGVCAATVEWKFDAVSIGYPGSVVRGSPVNDPVHLGSGWVGFDFDAAFSPRPVKIINDAAMQALGSYRGGRMLFLGLGTGLGSALIVDNLLEPMELAHLPYKKGRTYEDYVGLAGLERLGKGKWRQQVNRVVERLKSAVQADYVVLGGGNAKLLKKLPPDTYLGDNSNAFQGGCRLWDERQEWFGS